MLTRWMMVVSLSSTDYWSHPETFFCFAVFHVLRFLKGVLSYEVLIFGVLSKVLRDKTYERTFIHQLQCPLSAVTGLLLCVKRLSCLSLETLVKLRQL